MIKGMFPKSYSQLTIGKYQQLQNLMAMDVAEGIERDIRILALLGDTSVALVEAMSIEDFNKARARISFIYSEGSHILPSFFWLKGIMYRINTDPRKARASTYIDITTYTKNQKDRIDNLHLLMAAICTPFKMGICEDKKQTLEERASLFREHLTMDKVIPVSVFFLKLSEKLQTSIQSYLMQVIRRKRKALMKEVLSKKITGGS